jgi:hypothetical protein
MTNTLASCATLLGVLTSLSTVASAGGPADFFEVVAVTPSHVINHDVELKGPFDHDATETLLTGPQLFSHAVGFGENPVQEKGAYFNWYKIEKPSSKPRRKVSVRDTLGGNKTRQFTIRNAAFLLSPAQRVTTGPPSQIPVGLDHFKAYEIVNGPRLSHKVKLTGAFGPGDRITTEAAFLCVPVAQWHHDERSPIKDSQACMLVYDLRPQKCNVSVTTIDQFGLNTLEARRGKWICVPAQLVDDTPTDAE